MKLVDDQGEKVADVYEARFTGWTEEEYFQNAPENRICEFKDGEVIVNSPATPKHQKMVSFISTLVKLYCFRANRRGVTLTGPSSVRLRPGLDREPDVFWIPESEEHRLRETHLEGPPTFVVEVLSPESEHRDRVEKKTDYREAGVQEYWIVDHEQEQVEVHRLEGDTYRTETKTGGELTSTAVEGFYVRPRWLWSEPLPDEIECLKDILDEEGNI